jgi:hypothetical protein
MALDTAERIARLVDERIRDRQRLAQAAAEQKMLVAAAGSPAPGEATGAPPEPGVPPPALGLPQPPFPAPLAAGGPPAEDDEIRALRAENLALRRQLDRLANALLALAGQVGPSALEETRRHLAPLLASDPEARPEPRPLPPERGGDSPRD